MRLVVAGNVWLVLAVFLSNSIGCVLAAYCLARITDPGPRRLRRVLLTAVASWVLVESAYHNMLFVAATGLQGEGIEVRYVLASSVATIFVLTAVATGVLTLVAMRPTLPWVLLGGLVVGLITAASGLRAVESLRSNRVTSIDIRGSAVILVCFSVLVAVFVALTISSSHRALVASAILVLGAGLTAMQYLVAGHALFGAPAGPGGTATEGLLPTATILFTVLSLVIRMVVLVVVSLTDTTGSIRRQRRPAFDGPAG